MRDRAVWVTGLGATTAAGAGAADLLRLLVEERSALRPQAELGGEPAGRAPRPRRTAATRSLESTAAWFFAAAEEAWADAGLRDGGVDPSRCVLVEGSSLGPIGDLLVAHRRRLADAGAGPRPSDLLRFMTGAGGAAFAQAHGVCGPVWHLSAGSVSAACAIGEAYGKIARGEADVAVAGGADNPLQAEVVDAFRSAGVLADRSAGDAPCRPFDARRSGTVLGEGAGVLVLESAEHARRRGAAARAILTGFGQACEAYARTTPRPDGAGVAEAARRALKTSTANGSMWIKAHGTGTPLNDAAECRGLASLFGAALPAIPLTALKPALGHTLGASGAVEAVAVVLCLEAGVIPATLGTEHVDPALPPCRIATRLREQRARLALAVSQSFGGRCAALALQRA